MLQTLDRNHGFFKPDLHCNMRNSRNICTVAQNVEVDSVENTGGRVRRRVNYEYLNETPVFEISNVINTLPSSDSSVIGTEPLIVRIPREDFDKEIGLVLKNAIDSFERKCIILHSSSFHGTDIENMLLKSCGMTKEEIICHDVFPRNKSVNELKRFLQNPKDIIGIFQSRLVTGMECAKVIYMTSSTDREESVRCSITRAVQDLRILQRVDQGRNGQIRFYNW